MAIVFSINLQKGGVSKTTSCAALVWTLSEVHNKKVLGIDFDGQGHLTRILSGQSPYAFKDRTILEAIKEDNKQDYLFKVSENVDLLPSNAFLANFTSWLYQESPFKRRPFGALRHFLDQLKDQYDYVVIDTPPNLGEQSINALYASDFAIVPCESSFLAFSELDPQMELIEAVQNAGNKDLKLAGILVNVIDSRRKKDNEEFFQALEQYYPGLSFKSVVVRSADTSRIAKDSLYDNKRTKKAFEQYEPFVEELLKKVEK